MNDLDELIGLAAKNPFNQTLRLSLADALEQDGHHVEAAALRDQHGSKVLHLVNEFRQLGITPRFHLLWASVHILPLVKLQNKTSELELQVRLSEAESRAARAEQQVRELSQRLIPTSQSWHTDDNIDRWAESAVRARRRAIIEGQIDRWLIPPEEPRRWLDTESEDYNR